MIIISDTSALSYLAELGELDLLRQLYGTVTITATVRREAGSNWSASRPHSLPDGLPPASSSAILPGDLSGP